MLARPVLSLPGPGALPGGVVFEPKWDGYRLLVFARQGRGFVQSRAGADLTDAFPELAAAAAVLGEDVVLDGEGVIYGAGRLEFSALQHRIGRTPAAVARLARERPAHLILFDLLERGGQALLRAPYRERRAALEDLVAVRDMTVAPWALSPAGPDPDQAREWLTAWTTVGVEGVLAKGAAQTYQPGRRGWLKVRARHTTEAVVGAVTGPLTRLDTLLLGRHDHDGTLRLVARTAPLAPANAADLARALAPAAPGHPWEGMRISARWGSRERLEFTCVEPSVVAEFSGDTAVDAGYAPAAG